MFSFLSSIIAKKNIPILCILVIATVVRLVGIGYGQPLWVVGDEPSFIFGALKMLEVKTLVPSLHDEAFRGLLYYPPFLCYFYLIPFLLLIGVKFIFFAGSLVDFKNYLIVDLSSFFIIGRLISVLVGVCTVWLVYKIAKNIFKDEIVGLASASFLTLALLHVNFSHWARHWSISTFFFALIIYILSSHHLEISKRYRSAVLLCTLGAGITLPLALVGIFVAIWFFYYERLSFLLHIRKKWFWQALVGGLALVILAYIVWPRGFYVANNATLSFFADKTFLGFLGSYSFYLINLFRGEPLILLFASIGCAFGIHHFRRYIVSSLYFIFVYIAIFYLLFLQTDRFILILYPLFVTLAGYGFVRVLRFLAKYSRLCAIGFSSILIILQGFVIIKFDYLLVKNDTRIQARLWVEEYIPDKSKILVLTPLLRLSVTEGAIKEQEYIDQESLRSVDRAEALLSDQFFRQRRYHALNLNSVNSSTFFATLPQYIQNEEYGYIIYTSGFVREKGVPDSLSEIFGTELKQFTGYINTSPDSIINSFGDGVMELFQSSSIGPTIHIYELKNS